MKRKEKKYKYLISTEHNGIKAHAYSLEPYDGDAETLEAAGFEMLAVDAVGRLDALVSPVINQGVLYGVGHDSYKAVFDKGLGVLQKTKENDGLLLGNIVNPETNTRIKGLARWKKTSSTPQYALGVFNTLSIATGQYFMSQINEKMKEVSEDVADIKQFLNDEKLAELQTINRKLKNMYEQEDPFDADETSENLKKYETTAESVFHLYINQINQTLNKMQRSTDQTEMQKKRSVLIKQLAMCQYALNLYSSSIYMHTMLDGFRSVEDCDKNITQLRDEYLETCDAIEEKVDCVLSKGTRFRMSRNVYRRVERKRKRAIDARIAADILLPGMNGWAGFVAEVWHTDLLFEPIANRKKGYLLLIPANYLIDRIVLKWSLGDLEDKGLAITEDIGKALADVRALIEKQTVVA